MPRRLFTPPPPRRRITPRTPLPPEAEALFDIPAADERVGIGELTPEPVATRSTPEPSEAVPRTPAVQPIPEPASPSPEIPELIVQARRVDLLAVAREVGIDIVPRIDEPGFALAPCPACGDAAGAAVALNPSWNVRQWTCPNCKSLGGSLDLAALCLMGSTLGELDDEGQAMVRAWFTSMGWCDGD